MCLKAFVIQNKFLSSIYPIQISDDSEGSNDDDDDDELDFDKQMGDLGDAEADKLDEQVWGSDEEEDEQNEVNTQVSSDWFDQANVIIC